MKKAVKKKAKTDINESVEKEVIQPDIQPEEADGEPKESDDVIVIVEEYSDPDEEERPERKKKKKKSSEVEKPAEPEEKPKKKRKKKHRLLKLALVLAFLWFVLHGCLTLYFGGMNVKEFKKDYTVSDAKSNMFVTNILVIGTDTRNPQAEAGRSDCMMLMSINRLTRKIVLTSFLRDCYVSIPGNKDNRINAAFSIGGAPLLIQTIEQNFKVDIDGYVIIDFYSCMDIIDAVGGVTVEVTAEEANYVNMYLCEINQLLGIEQGNGNLTEVGSLKLSGKQALAYSRIRYIGTDFGRTDRQREVIMGLFDAVKGANIFKFIGNVKSVFPEITTSVSAAKLGNYAMELPFWAFYTFEQQRVPADNTWSSFITDSGMDVLKLDFSANIERLHSSIY